MSMSSTAAKLLRPNVVEMPRLEDRISFLYLDRVRIEQDQTGVLAHWASERGQRLLRIPVGSLAVLIIGPGTSITSPAMTSLYRAGCSLLTSGEGGQVGYACARPLTGRAAFAEAQARMWADDQARLAGAYELYRLRFNNVDSVQGLTLQQLRGLEGRQVRLLYKQLAARHHIVGFRRRTTADDGEELDPVNALLNLGNSILYGAALAACSTLGLNPALGVVHQGASGAFLFDLADMYKHRSSIPFAFELAAHPDRFATMRRRMRDFIQTEGLLKDQIAVCDRLLKPHVRSAAQDVLLDDSGVVPGGVNHGDSGVQDQS